MTFSSTSAGPTTDDARRAAALDAFRAGWVPLPLPAGRKASPPEGWTGRAGRAMTTLAEVEAFDWSGNMALRLVGVLGIDVDVEGADDILDSAQEKLGPLPPTWSTSRRGVDSSRRIHLFRVPVDLDFSEARLRTLVGRDQLDLIQHKHRYILAAPSVVDGMAYGWRGPHGADSSLPVKTSIPWMPDAWVEALREDTAGADVPRGNVSSAAGDPFAPPPEHDGVWTREQAGAFYREKLAALTECPPGSKHAALLAFASALGRFHEALPALQEHAWSGVRDAWHDRPDAVGDWAAARSTFDDGWRYALARPQAVLAPDPERGDAPVARPLPSHLPVLPDDFWAARGWLTELRMRARARRASPDAVLGAYLALKSSQIPAGVTVDTTLGTPQTPGLFAVLVGPSGTGKSVGHSLAQDLCSGPRIAALGLSTGQGLVEAFWGKRRVMDPADPEVKPTDKRVRTSGNAYFYLDEGKALMGQAADGRSITGPVLRAAWSGGDVGQHNASEDLRRQLDRHTYSLGFTMGLQLGVAAQLLADTDTGMAQRFLWFSTLDPDMPDERPDVGPFASVLVHPVHPDHALVVREWIIDGVQIEPARSAPITVSLAIVAELEARLLAAHRDGLDAERDELDSHEVVNRLKLAGVLAYLDGSNVVTDEVWSLASTLYDTSAAVRDAVLERNQLAALAERDQLALERGRATGVAASYQDRRGALAARVLEFIGAETRSGRALGEKFRHDRKGLLPEVLADLVVRRLLTLVPAADRRSGPSYRAP